MVAGDTCLIMTGTYRETVTPSASGTASAPITFQAGEGQIVTITGTQSMGTDWTQESTNIYYAPMAWTLGTGNQVFQNGSMKPEARWPNAGVNYPSTNSSIKPSPDWAYVTAASYPPDGTSPGTMTDTGLPTRADGYWNGCTVNIMSGLGWLEEFITVSGYNDATKTLTTSSGMFTIYGTEVAISAGNEYFISGKKEEMDSNGEWFKDEARSRLYMYSTGAPANVESKKRPYGFDLSGKSYIVLKNLNFFACTIQSSAASSYCTLDGLTMRYPAHSVGENQFNYTPALRLRNNFVLRNSDLAFAHATLVRLAGNDIRVINNRLHDAGYSPVFSAVIDGRVDGSYVPLGYRNLVSHNTVCDSGGQGIACPGKASVIEFNDVYNVMRLTCDAGTIGSNDEAGNTVVRYNLIHDSPGPLLHPGGNPLQGFYLDSQNSSWIVHHNVIWNIAGCAIQINNRNNFNMVFNNTCFGSSQGSLTQWGQEIDGPSGSNYYNNILHGTVVSGGTDWSLSDLRYNLNADPLLVDPSNHNFNVRAGSPAINAGTYIPGITPASGITIGALQYGGTDWTTQCGYKTTPPDPDPSYTAPDFDFANKVVDGSFESGSFSPNWTTTATLQPATLVSGNSWTDMRQRSKYFSVECGAGTTEIKQTVTGLLSNHRYALHVGTRGADSGSPTIHFGVRNFGNATLEGAAPSGSQWHMNRLTFVTGTASTTAEIYANVSNPDGWTSKAYIDDFSVQLNQEYRVAYPQTMPMAQFNFDEGAGTTAYDHSTLGYNATISGTAAWTAGINGGAIQFNGTNSYAVTPSFATPGSVTVACWAKSAVPDWNSDYSLISKRPSFLLHPSTGTKRMNFIIAVNINGTPATQWICADLSDITGWHSYVGTYDQATGTQAIYVDGVCKQSYSNPSYAGYPLLADSSPLYIGRDGMSDRYLNGSVDNVRIYGYAMPQNEVTGIQTTDTTMLLHYKFDDAAGSTKAWDATGNGLPCTLNGIDPATDWVTGKDVGALNFNGTTSYAVSPSFANPASVTLALWAKSTSTNWSNTNCTLAYKSASFAIHTTTGTKTVNFIVNVGGNAQWMAVTPADITVWHHYVCTYNQTTGKQSNYVDGILQTSYSNPSFAGVPLTTTNSPLYMGHSYGGNNGLNGLIDDVRVYPRELNANEVSDLVYQRDFPPYSGY